MARKKPPVRLSQLQLAVMKSLWARGTASVNEVHKDLFQALQLAPTTIATVLRRMEAKKLVTHEELGRQFIYRPQICESEIAESAAEEVLDHLFEGRLAEMVMHLLEKRKLGRDELDQLSHLIAEKRKQFKSKEST